MLVCRAGQECSKLTLGEQRPANDGRELVDKCPHLPAPRVRQLWRVFFSLSEVPSGIELQLAPVTTYPLITPFFPFPVSHLHPSPGVSWDLLPNQQLVLRFLSQGPIPLTHLSLMTWHSAGPQEAFKQMLLAAETLACFTGERLAWELGISFLVFVLTHFLTGEIENIICLCT